MKNKIGKFLNLVLIFSIFVTSFYTPIKVKAASATYLINTSATYKTCSVKTEPNEGGNWSLPGVAQWLDPGDKVTTIDGDSPVISTNPVCKSAYYHILFGSTPGYVCGDYIGFDSAGTYDQYFRELGFPDSYLPYLNVLKSLHPTWTFRSVQTGLDWNTVLDNESPVGVSLLNTISNPGWLSTAGGAYDYYTDTFYDNIDGKGWYAANRDAVAYYMDPRNFLNGTDIFMFENLKYEESQSASVVSSILSDTFMNGNFTDTDGVVRSYTDTFMEIGKTTGVSPYLLASRVKQEVSVGSTGYSRSVSGNVSGYENYFNYFNINAFATKDSAGNILVDGVTNGLNYAKLRSWDTRYESILGGAQVIGAGYINIDPINIDQNQNTLYSQKWDFVGSLYSHQYMSNIMAPKSEASSIYRAYANLAVLNNTFNFAIPVFNNMPSSTSMPNTGNPNNYLKTLSVNGADITGFDGSKTDYTYYVSTSLPTVKIAGNPVNSGSTISGLGDIVLSSKEQTTTIRVTAQNGATKDYNIKIITPDTIPISVAELANNIGIKNDGTYMSGIAIGTNVDAVINKVKQVNSLATATIKNSNGTVISNISFGTGDKVIITSNNETKEYTVIIYGDATGDGLVSIADLLRVQKRILGQLDLSEPYVKATDVNHDSRTDIADLLKVQKKILGLVEIDQ